MQNNMIYLFLIRDNITEEYEDKQLVIMVGI